MKVLLDLAKADHGCSTIGGTRYRDMVDPACSVGLVLLHKVGDQVPGVLRLLSGPRLPLVPGASKRPARSRGCRGSKEVDPGSVAAVGQFR